jgi:hypothetical protein
MKYFALSYVWGHSPSTCALLANLHILQKKDALGNFVELPRTIAHVIRLTKLLEGRYLWVDRLCIVQDDGLVKQAQLDRMGDIYAEAFATFVAASGSDARDVLKGISGVTGRRYFSGDSLRLSISMDDYDNELSTRLSTFYRPDSDFRYAQVTIKSAELARDSNCNSSVKPDTDDCKDAFDKIAEVDSDVSIDSKFENTAISEIASTDLNSRTTGEMLVEQAQLLMKSKWYSRGWTFQENMLSCRKIIFQDETVNWECLSAAWHEAEGPLDDHHHQMLDNQPIPRSLSFDNTTWPDFYRFARLVSLYNLRHFSYPEDIMNAFAGVISLRSRSFAGGFVTGLP